MEDALLPYPKKAKSSVADASFTISVPTRTGVTESETGVTVASAVSPELSDERDTWAMSDDEETDAFWRRSPVRTADNVKQPICDTDAGIDTSVALDDNDNTSPDTQVTEQAERVGNTAADSLSGVVNKDVTDPAVSLTCRAVDTDMHVELSSQNIDEVISDTVSSGCNDVVDSRDERCDNNASEADVCVDDDTDDSDVDEAYQSSWQTVMKKDPYPVKEHLLLSLEEVSSSTAQQWQI